jgi:hypothetical protein
MRSVGIVGRMLLLLLLLLLLLHTGMRSVGIVGTGGRILQLCDGRLMLQPRCWYLPL